MKLRIASGHELLEGQTIHDFDRVRFIAEDGRTMFEVGACANGTSIEVRAVNVCKVGDKLHEATLLVAPRASNAIIVSVPEYGK